nr:MAG TPA: hypothetical protein [Caudoviricetes sp.]
MGELIGETRYKKTGLIAGTPSITPGIISIHFS